MMDIEELDINAVCFGILCNFPHFCGEERAKEAAELVRALQAENKRLQAELERVKRCIEIIEHQKDKAIYDMTVLMAGQCCDLCAVEYCNDRGKTEMCTAFKWRGTQKED